ncbi:MAG: AAA family ATPase, partial [Acidobacteria bacterium]|nr:AAA family ATPase [Acidobacteriota bacterium]
MTDAKTSRRFAVALSFPGEHRAFVEQVAEQLAASFSQERVLYDQYHDAEFAQPDLDVYLPNLYRAESELLVIFLCAEYAAKRWCKLEWRHIRQLIPTVEAKRIMFLSFGDPGDLTEIGILPGDGYINIGAQSATTIAEKICKRLNLNHGFTPPTTLPSASSSFKADISRIVKYAPPELIGREAELKLLDDAWNQAVRGEKNRPHIVTFVALGGEGKTSLVAKWAATLAAQDWPGCEAVFAWSFYSQGTREQMAASSDVFLREALIFFGDEATANSPKLASEKARRLAQLVGQRRALLILDGVEPLQYPPLPPMNGQLRDQALADLLKALATTNRGLCVVTTRYSLPDLQAFWQTTAAEQKLLRLSREAGVRLLKTLDVKGAAQEFDSLVEEVKGHALTLNLLGTYLRDAHEGDIRRRDLVRLAEADEEEQGGHAFRVMAAYERHLESEGDKGQRALAILRLMGLFDRPATVECLHALWQSPAIPNLTEPLIGITEAQRNLTLKRLEDARLLTVNRDAAGTLLSLDAHPLLREYFAARVRSSGFSRQQLGTSGRAASQPQPPEGGTTNATTNAAWREAHKRVYEHLCATTKEGDQPTLEELQPLYQAVAHGCQAGLQQEACEKVYRARILRGTASDGFYSWRKLGAFGSDLGAVACFFESPWSRVSPALTESGQAWLLSEAAFRLRALGRLTESLEPMRTGMENYVKQESWGYAASVASNLSELELTLGLVDAATRDAAQSLEYADRSGDVWQRIGRRVALANSQHQKGILENAQTRFAEAETIFQSQAKSSNCLVGTWGVYYCDLLLAVPERAAWKQLLGLNATEAVLESIDVCGGVTQRATQMLQWAEKADAALFEFALDHLTLGRATLYSAILESSNSRLPTPDSSHIENAVTGLRRSGDQDLLPLGLLTRAWLRALTGALTGPDSAQEDLDEAWDIASRGSMKLHLADIHLYRARLFYREQSYP